MPSFIKTLWKGNAWFSVQQLPFISQFSSNDKMAQFKQLIFLKIFLQIKIDRFTIIDGDRQIGFESIIMIHWV